jgi:hypothetical protein
VSLELADLDFADRVRGPGIRGPGIRGPGINAHIRSSRFTLEDLSQQIHSSRLTPTNQA